MPDQQATRILLAEDNADIRTLVVCRLEQAGFVVTAVGDGLTAARVVAEGLPDLAILDIHMPGADGLTVTRRLRADERTPRLPIILFSALCDASDVARGLAAGADDYVGKPSSPAELHRRVTAVLEARRAPLG